MSKLVLIMSPDIQDKIDAAVKRADARPIPLSVIAAGAVSPGKSEVTLADRKPGFERPESEHVEIPTGYRCAFSVEEQLIGLCGHLSISVPTPGRLPHPRAVEMICDAYGIDMNKIEAIWLEEFDVGHQAVNIIALRHPVEMKVPS